MNATAALARGFHGSSQLPTVKVAGKEFCMRNNQFFDRISSEMREIVRDAAAPVKAGETVKGQQRRAWENLGRPPYWRVRKAWFGHAGNWVAAAVEDFRTRHHELQEKRARREAAERAAGRVEAADYAARLDRLRMALTNADEDFYRAEINALRFAIDRCRG